MRSRGFHWFSTINSVDYVLNMLNRRRMPVHIDELEIIGEVGGSRRQKRPVADLNSFFAKIPNVILIPYHNYRYSFGKCKMNTLPSSEPNAIVFSDATHGARSTFMSGGMTRIGSSHCLECIWPRFVMRNKDETGLDTVQSTGSGGNVVCNPVLAILDSSRAWKS